MHSLAHDGNAEDAVKFFGMFWSLNKEESTKEVLEHVFEWSTRWELYLELKKAYIWNDADHGDNPPQWHMWPDNQGAYQKPCGSSGVA